MRRFRFFVKRGTDTRGFWYANGRMPGILGLLAGTEVDGLKFILLTQYYPPEPGAASIRLQAMARQLIRYGHQVTVVTAQAHHLGAKEKDGRGSFRAYRETIQGIPVIRAWIWRVRPGRFWLRLINYFSFVVTSFFALWRAGAADYVIVESPPLFLGMTAWAYQTLRGVPYILSVSDLWPESAVALGLVTQPTVIRLARRLEWFLYRHAALVSGVTQGILDGIRDTGQVPPHRLLFFPNGVDPAVFRRGAPDGDLRRRMNPDRYKIFLYPGTLGYAQGLTIILDAADHLRQRSDIRFLLVGDGPVRAELIRQVDQRGLTNVWFEPLQPADRMPQYFALARAVVVPLRRHPLFRGARPSKVFPAWAAGVPVIYCGEGEMAELVEEAQAGRVVPPEDGEALAQAVVELADLPDADWTVLSQNGERFVREHYTWDRIGDAWIQAFHAGLRA